MQPLSNLLFGMLRMSTPLLLAGMAGVLSQQVNLLNIALEGLMLAGAFFAVVIGAYFGSAWSACRYVFRIVIRTDLRLLHHRPESESDRRRVGSQYPGNWYYLVFVGHLV